MICYTNGEVFMSRLQYKECTVFLVCHSLLTRINIKVRRPVVMFVRSLSWLCGWTECTLTDTPPGEEALQDWLKIPLDGHHKSRVRDCTVMCWKRELDFRNKEIYKYINKLCFILFSNSYYWGIGDRGGTVIKVLWYKSEGRWFDPRWYHWNFSLT